MISADLVRWYLDLNPIAQVEDAGGMPEMSRAGKTRGVGVRRPETATATGRLTLANFAEVPK